MTRPRASRAIAVGAVGIGGFLLGTAALGGFAAVGISMALAVGLSTALLSALLAALALGSGPGREEASVSAWAVLGGMVFGMANTAGSLLMVGIVSGEAFRVLLSPSPPGLVEACGVFVVLTAVGSVVAAPLGLVFGAIYLVLLRRAHQATEEGALDGAERTCELAGPWLAAVAALSLVAFEIWAAATEIPEGAVTQMGALCGAVAVVGLGLGLAARRRRRRRVAWLGKVERGLHPAWAVVPAPRPLPELPPLLSGGGGRDGVLVELRPGRGAGAYRRGAESVPRALVPLGADEGSVPRVREGEREG